MERSGDTQTVRQTDSNKGTKDRKKTLKRERERKRKRERERERERER